MDDTEHLNGRNSAGASMPPFHDSRSLGEHGRQLYHDATALAGEVRGTTAELERFFVDQLRRRPYRALGVAAGIGYVLGGGLRSRATAALLGVAARVAMAMVAREFEARLSPDATAPTTSTRDEP